MSIPDPDQRYGRKGTPHDVLFHAAQDFRDRADSPRSGRRCASRNTCALLGGRDLRQRAFHSGLARMGCLPGRTDEQRRGLRARPHGHGALGRPFRLDHLRSYHPHTHYRSGNPTWARWTPSTPISWSCPRCGEWLPPFRAITVNAVETIKSALAGASVFFLDRLSRANLILAAEASARGAVVVFEPSSKATDKLMAEGLALAHVVKYAGDRLAGFLGAMDEGSAALLEVRTLGERGLHYRHRLGRGTSNWMHLKAVPPPRLADACGSGDWCTAGFIAKAAVGGQKGLRRAGARGVRAALRYGQALAAWNCCFEGARGGMYAATREAFKTQIAGLQGRPT